MKAFEVGVIGGGPCGLMAALLLARAGVRTVVFESKAELSSHPKAMGLSRRTCEIFRQTGILDRIKDGALDLDGRSLAIWSKSLVGEELGRIPLTGRKSEFTPCESMHCPQTWTEQTLLEAVQAENLAEVRFGERVVGFVPGDDCVKLSLANGEELEVPWVLAADGAGSHTRDALGIEADGPGDMGHFVNVLFRAPLGEVLTDRLAVLYNVACESVQEFFVAVDGREHWLMHHFLMDGMTAEDFSEAMALDRIRAGAGITDLEVEVLGMSPWVMSPKVARAWRKGRIFLIGDAAARLSPAGGLGLNTGLQGTHNLVWKLAAVIRGEAVPTLLDTYEAERRDVAMRIMMSSNQNAEEVMAIVMAAVYGKWDEARSAIAHSRRGGSGLGQDLGVQYMEGAFASDGSAPKAVADPVNDYLADARPGCRAPHVPLAGDGDRSILDLFGGEFVALLGREAECWQCDLAAVLRNGRDFETDDFETAYGISPQGAVLVRPDGYVAARFPGAKLSTDPSLSEVVGQILRGR